MIMNESKLKARKEMGFSSTSTVSENAKRFRTRFIPNQPSTFDQDPGPYIQFSRRKEQLRDETDEEYEQIERAIHLREEEEAIRRHKNQNFYQSVLYTVTEFFKDEIKYLFYVTDLTMRKYTEKDVRRAALTSRILVLLLQMIACLTLPKHNNDGFKTPGLPYYESTELDRAISATFGGFANWDGQYFLHIATNGYTHQNTIAFFPLFPWMIGIPAKLLNFILFPLLSLQSIVLAISWVFNTICFQKAAVKLSQIVEIQSGNSRHLIPTAVYLFCYNPASIFFSALYSESLFALLTFSCVLALYKKSLGTALVYASLGAVCRSNGLLNFWLVGAGLIGILLTESHSKTDNSQVISRNDLLSPYRWALFLKVGFLTLGALVPFIAFQFYCVHKFCNTQKAEVPGKLPPFCSYNSLPYSYIQSANWNVGFLEYFQAKQIPNFMLALPVLWTLSGESLRHLRDSRKLNLGNNIFSFHNFLKLSCGWHGLFISFTCFFFIYVQVSTRMIMSSCPYIYFFIAERMNYENYLYLSRRIRRTPYNYFVLIWFSLYFLVGTVGFALGYPWT